MRKRGQMITADTLIAISIFIIILISIIWSWDLATTRISQNSDRDKMHNAARIAFSSLIETPGKPGNWYDSSVPYNKATIHSLGLTQTYPSILHNDKLTRLSSFNFSSIEYNETKEILGIEEYEFNLKVFIRDGITYPSSPDFLIGTEPNSTTEEVVLFIRNVLLDGKDVRVRFSVWR